MEPAHVGRRRSLQEPFATGREGATHHSLQGPGYRADPDKPASSMANRLWHAVMPEPHWWTTWSAGRPCKTASNSARRTAGDLNRPSGPRFSGHGLFKVPGICPATG